MKDILSTIVEHKRMEVDSRKVLKPMAELRAEVLASPRPTRSLRDALASSDSGIIAEFKRKSPSKGWIHENVEPEEVVPGYAAAGASALSILTDGEYFGGSMAYIRRMRPLVNIPILCKEFIIDEYQIYEAALAGADAVLLIAACLPKDECCRLIGCAKSLGLETLLELHSESEQEYLDCGSAVYGINNRHLGSFVTDVAHSFALAERIDLAESASSPDGRIWVSESGISRAETIAELRKAGFRGFLMGEAFMKHDDPAAALASFIEEVRKNEV